MASKRSQSTGSSGFNPWDTGSVAYQRLILTGMALLGIGILLAIIGAVTSVMMLSKIAIAFLALGVVVHLMGQWTRFRQALRDRKARGGQPKKK